MPITAKIFESSIAKIIYDKMVFHKNQFRFTMKEVGVEYYLDFGT